MKKLDVLALSVSLGIVWGLVVMCLAWCAMFGWGSKVVDVISSIYIGYDATVVGGFVGLAWGFVDCFILGAILALIYNALCRKDK